jgi:thiosulfate reductase cytochrome b subunit
VKLKRVKPTPATHDIQEHPALVRIAHWLQALAIIVMIGSGWRIYNSEPIFGYYRFPIWATLGGNPMLSKIAHMDPADKLFAVHGAWLDLRPFLAASAAVAAARCVA